MRKGIALLLCIALCTLVGCDNSKTTEMYDAEANIKNIHSDYFNADVVEDLGGGCYVIKDSNSGVLYLVCGGYNSCIMTPIYNADGTLKTQK